MGEHGRVAPLERTQPIPCRQRMSPEPLVFARHPPHDESIDRAEFLAKLRGVKSPIVAHPSGEEGARPSGDFVQLKITAQMHSPPSHLQPYPFGSLITDRGDEADKALLVSANRRS